MAGTLRSKPVLTPLMRSVLAALASGKTVAETADDLFIAERAVYTQLAEAKTRLGALNTAQAVLIAHRHGYIALPDDSGVVISTNPHEDP